MGSTRVGDSLVLPIAAAPHRERIVGVQGVRQRQPPRKIVALLSELRLGEIPAVRVAPYVGQLPEVGRAPSDEIPAV